MVMLPKKFGKWSIDGLAKSIPFGDHRYGEHDESDRGFSSKRVDYLRLERSFSRVGGQCMVALELTGDTMLPDIKTAKFTKTMSGVEEVSFEGPLQELKLAQMGSLIINLFEASVEFNDSAPQNDPSVTAQAA